MTRGTRDVFHDHLRLRAAGDLETDLRRNYARDVVLLTVNSNARGHDAMRISAGRLARQLPGARFEFLARQVRGPFALLIWRGYSCRCDAIGGADSFLITGGLIRMQTIHYQLLSHMEG
ncbi:hypothetical protein [Pontibaca methylaminivorans]|uniref:SnoaL-like domain-containing protein n=1 Tax=Pontibaca methylaminivorans TaxID=515897 RepID=A0A1R3X8R3_9RHOB|nr:hypothetical protein [Pontibaca methylaminivorans]SIT86650.1 hypothetical protein SAMN05421849_2355 [Pontibaca methylaminivorans]